MGKKDESSKKYIKGKFISSGLSTGIPEFNFPKNMGIPAGVFSMMESMQRIQDIVNPPGLQWIREMNQSMERMLAPIKAVADITAGMQNHYLPLNNQLQVTMSGLQNNSLLRIAQSMQGITDQYQSSIALKALQGPALFPNIAADFLRRDIWENYPEEDEELEEAAEILEEVKESGKLSDEAVNRLIALTEESLAEQKKTNKTLSQSAATSQASLKLQKLQLFLTILMMIISFQSDRKESENTNESPVISQETAAKLDHLFEILSENEKETTGNLNLRSAPNTREETKIYLTIPKGETVAIQYSVPSWSFVYYAEPETGILRSGWVSKRWLD